MRKRLSRRDYLKYLSGGAASIAVTSFGAHVPLCISDNEYVAAILRAEESVKPLPEMMWDAMEGDLAWEDRKTKVFQ